MRAHGFCPNLDPFLPYYYPSGQQPGSWILLPPFHNGDLPIAHLYLPAFSVVTSHHLLCSGRGMPPGLLRAREPVPSSFLLQASGNTVCPCQPQASGTLLRPAGQRPLRLSPLRSPGGHMEGLGTALGLDCEAQRMQSASGWSRCQGTGYVSEQLGSVLPDI